MVSMIVLRCTNHSVCPGHGQGGAKARISGEITGKHLLHGLWVPDALLTGKDIHGTRLLACFIVPWSPHQDILPGYGYGLTESILRAGSAGPELLHLGPHAVVALKNV